jgi:regulator of ribonuclease activity A
LLGDVIGGIAVTHGWGGVLLHGAVRDTVALGRLELGVKALGTNPKKSLKKGTGEANVPVTFGSVTFVPGHFLYSDDDGVLVSPDALGV